MELNAANRVKLTVPQGSLLSYNTGIAADGENLYLLLLGYDADAMQTTNTALCHTNVSKNKLEHLCDLEKGNEWNIIGVYPDGIILQRSHLPAGYAHQDMQEQLPYLQYELQLYSLKENRLIDTDFAWSQGELSFVLDQGIAYFVKNGDICLYAHDLQTGEERIVTDNIFGEIHTEPETSVLINGAIHDHHIIFSALHADYSSHYSYDLTSQKTMPLTLSFEHEGAEIPVFICAENDEYWVSGGIMTIPLSCTGTDGSLYTIDSSMTEYMLIKKDDYWNCAPNYIPFDEKHHIMYIYIYKK